jgi:hypothetical protein
MVDDHPDEREASRDIDRRDAAKLRWHGRQIRVRHRLPHSPAALIADCARGEDGDAAENRRRV